MKTNELQGVFYRKHSICLQTNWKLGPFLYHQEWLGRCEHTYMWPLLTAKHDREDKQKKKELLWFSQRTIMTLALRVLKNLSSSWTRRRKNSSCGSMWCQWHVLLLSLTSGSHFQKRSRPIIIAWPLLNFIHLRIARAAFEKF